MIIKTSLLAAGLLLTSSLDAEPYYHYNHALVRELADSFTDSLKREQPEHAIDVERAKEQHERYSQLVQRLVPDTRVLGADTLHPDCNFIEDTAVIVGNDAIICRMGAKARQGEEREVAKMLAQTGLTRIHFIEEPGRIDGGDVLYTGKHLFIGLSSRTNAAAIAQMADLLEDVVHVVAIPVGDSLHLKSLVSFFDESTIVVADDPSGRAVQKAIELATRDYTFIPVPDRVAANVLRIRDHLVVQRGFPQSEAILRSYAEAQGINMHTLEMSELIKADGALTCGSLLF